jgi:alkylated DNA repair dioxygenase AlkB
MHNLLPADGCVEYLPGFLSPQSSENYFRAFEQSIAWQADQVKIYGKVHTLKRKIAWYGDAEYAYRYSQSTKTARPWTEELLKLKTQLEAFTGESFNSCLLNYYHDGNDCMGWHCDNEKMMQTGATIASISLGAERIFKFKHKHTKEICSILLEQGSLLLMKGETQQHWKHSLPASKKVSAPRINLTFRVFDTPS